MTLTVTQGHHKWHNVSNVHHKRYYHWFIECADVILKVSQMNTVVELAAHAVVSMIFHVPCALFISTCKALQWLSDFQR